MVEPALVPALVPTTADGFHAIKVPPAEPIVSPAWNYGPYSVWPTGFRDDEERPLSGVSAYYVVLRL